MVVGRKAHFHLSYIPMFELNNFSVFTWNVKGLGSMKARRNIMDMINYYKPSLVAFMETYTQFDKV